MIRNAARYRAGRRRKGSDVHTYRIEFLDEHGDVLACNTIADEDPGTAEARARTVAGRAVRNVESDCYAPEVKRARLVDESGIEIALRTRRRRRALTA